MARMRFLPHCVNYAPVEPMPSHPTLQQVAAAAGVSIMTVSRALRNHPEIAKATRERILALSEKLGYRPDPFVSRAMSRARRGRNRAVSEPLAVVWPHKLTIEDRANPRRVRLLSGVRDRAAMLGMCPQEFELDGLRVTPERLSRTLFNRGVRALLLLPAFPYPSGAPAFVWDRFCAATLGFGPMADRLHRASHDHFESMRQVLSHLATTGRCRPAALLSQEIDEFVHRRHSAAFLAFAPGQPQRALRRDADMPSREHIRWFKDGKFDSLIVQHEPHPDLIKQLDLPPEAIVSLHWNPEVMCAGIDQMPERVAAAAIDIIMGQLTRNERGLPLNPRTLLVPGEWRDASNANR